MCNGVILVEYSTCLPQSTICNLVDSEVFLTSEKYKAWSVILYIDCLKYTHIFRWLPEYITHTTSISQAMIQYCNYAHEKRVTSSFCIIVFFWNTSNNTAENEQTSLFS